MWVENHEIVCHIDNTDLKFYYYIIHIIITIILKKEKENLLLFVF